MNSWITQPLDCFFPDRFINQRRQGVPNSFPRIVGMPQEGSGLDGYPTEQQILELMAMMAVVNSNRGRPVAATEEALGKLEREVLEEGSPLLEKDCAICKDQFSLQTEDPDEQVVITLPCQHPFHSSCILPWFEQSGTCPTCRHQLVPQPGSAQDPNGSSGGGPGPSTSTTNPPQATSPTTPRPAQRNGGAGGGLFGVFNNLIHSLTAGHTNAGPVPSSSNSGPDSLPGSWEPVPSSTPTSRRSQTTQFEGQQGSPHGSNYANSGRGDRGGGSADGWASHDLRSHGPGGHNRDRGGRRDGNGQRNYSWEDSELD